MRLILHLSVAALTLVFPGTVYSNEFTPDFVDEMVSGCIEWIDTSESTTFDKKWHISKETAQARKRAESNPELAPRELLFLSPDLNYTAGMTNYASLGSELSVCDIMQNYMGLDENSSISSTPIEFNYQLALAALKEWGSERASNLNFVEWPEEVEKKALNMLEDFIFLKKRCDAHYLTTIEARAKTQKSFLYGQPFTSWWILVRRYSAADKETADYVFSACPQGS